MLRVLILSYICQNEFDMNTTQKAQALIDNFDNKWLYKRLGVTGPTLLRRMKGKHTWRLPERAMIDDLYEKASKLLDEPENKE